MAEPIVSRGQQLEAAVDRLPDWYFAAAQVLPSPIKVNNSSLFPALGPVCETEDKPQPLDEDDIQKPRDPPSNATMTCTEDELELEKLDAARRQQSDATQQIRQQELGQSTASSRRSTASSSGACSDLVLSGFSMRGREKKVMYHIDVVDHDAPLQTYTIRRSYSDFKDLHIQLSEILENRQAYYRSKAVSRLARGVVPAPTEAMTQEEKIERSIMAFTLPSLPHAGFLTFWKRHDRSHLQSRCDSFQELLRAVQQIPFLQESFAMQKFLSVAPCAIRERGSSYVSLCEYSVPTLNPEEEQRERKRRAQQYRRNSSSSNHSTRMVEY
ncbi:hypothetical protein JG687_00006047 [Phytophthora cactorum]|uniref:PX domain-containing protein n=1 Tax=Phytophthora cactorum TaxID=29920 RepID=A0A8T1UNR6_9STRA|nr:hypothetical protein PC120_g11782 [Phytophthora cactorum]KAG3060722.1 hypothetical protein PC121_g13313 [Phytophthora cactorum]KAG3182213.1 hypothetical protein PC128_g14773 [Phytophthora cactorum]KAG4053203.1 hypothetical protein PC123_g11659 [Phytophthora cactorum]KAG6964310.1 hypothetical protein JG687_00006047 [Phytophthora cactorum]